MSLAEWMEALDAILPEACPQCNKPGAFIEVNCVCKFKLKTCAKCLAENREAIHEALREHMTSCKDGENVIRALGY